MFYISLVVYDTADQKLTLCVRGYLLLIYIYVKCVLYIVFIICKIYIYVCCKY